MIVVQLRKRRPGHICNTHSKLYSNYIHAVKLGFYLPIPIDRYYLSDKLPDKPVEMQYACDSNIVLVKEDFLKVVPSF